MRGARLGLARLLVGWICIFSHRRRTKGELSRLSEREKENAPPPLPLFRRKKEEGEGEKQRQRQTPSHTKTLLTTV